ncbi:MAG: hypothetical protein GXP09_04395 [Gammaproteobacteria bacterium]|nr:hypothetical protein [Gammaproteobacteria bacterium]
MPHTQLTARLVIILLCLSWAGSAHSTELVLEVVSLKHQLAKDLIPAIRPLLGPKGSISGAQQKLFIKDDPQNITHIKTALKQLDVAQANLLVSLRFWDIGNTNQGDIQHQYSTQRQQKLQTIRVLEGKTGFIEVGKSRVDTQYFVNLAHDQLALTESEVVRSVTSGFLVTVHLLQGIADVKITPRFSFAVDDSLRHVRFYNMASQIKVQLGRWAIIGSNDTNLNEVHAAIWNQYTTHRDETARIQIKVEKVDKK